MAKGRLGASDLSATTYTAVYTCSASSIGAVTLTVCNRNSNSVAVRVAISTSATTPSNSEFIEYDTSIPGNSVLERSGLLLDSTNKYLVVYSSSASVSAVVYGIEESV